MDTNINNYIARTRDMDWRPLTEEGINTGGIYVKVLRYDEVQQRPPSILLKFDPGARYPYHNHPAGEEIFVMKGRCQVNETLLEAGDYLYTPPNFKHAVRSDEGCELMLVIPEEVENS
ncbi:MAG: cupin domain-containing protein [Bacteroidia bacterium]|nr:cupin domain-containing protein [Bacteroidia bacterium]